MKHLVPDYKLPSYKDPKVSETELRAAVHVLTDAIARFRETRNKYEIILAKRYVADLEKDKRYEGRPHSLPFNSDLEDVYKKRVRKY